MTYSHFSMAYISHPNQTRYIRLNGETYRSFPYLSHDTALTLMVSFSTPHAKLHFQCRSSGSLSYPAPMANYNGNGVRILYPPTTPGSAPGSAVPMRALTTEMMLTPAPLFKTPRSVLFRVPLVTISLRLVSSLPLSWSICHSVRSTPVAHPQASQTGMFRASSISSSSSPIFLSLLNICSLSYFPITVCLYLILTAGLHTRSPVPSLSQYDASLCISGTHLLHASNIVHLASIYFSRPFISSYPGLELLQF
jgi:hypothetical protein